MVKNKYALFLLEELFDWLGSAKVFGKIDLQSGYWQMSVKPEDVHKTPFKMRWGLYEIFVVPFGITNTPAQFMNMKNDLLSEYLDKLILVFLDDFPIIFPSHRTMLNTYGRSWESLGSISCMQKASKCEIFKTSVEFLE